jgi:16S rRNA (uracil1498-N3)-methyltransferase
VPPGSAHAPVGAGRAGPPTAGPAALDAIAHVLVERLDDRIRLDGDDGHHLQRVRRLRVGETVTAADGTGRYRCYGVADVAPGILTLTARGEVGHEARRVPGLSVAFALTKGDRPELVVQKLTELGVDRILVVAAARSVVRWDDSRTAVAMDRLVRVAREAAAQCRRARLPVVEGLVPLAEVAAEDGLVVADRGGVPAGELAAPTGAGWLVLVGPEGGFTDEERALVAGAPVLTVGPHVLRAETAALAVAAALAGRRHAEPSGDRNG